MKRLSKEDAFQRVKHVVERGIPLVQMRPYLEQAFGKKVVTFTFSPVACFIIKNGADKLCICNAKNAGGADAVVGEYAIGYI